MVTVGDDGALRTRRYRAHRAGDHSFCGERCDETAAQAPSQPVTSLAAPAGLGPRGSRLWADLATTDRTPAELAVVDEVARLADRLDRLDALIRGDVDAWARLVPRDDGAEYVLQVDAALSQARMHAATLRTLVTELRASAAARPPGSGEAGPDRDDGWLDDLAAARARRVADATGGPVPAIPG